MKQHSRTGVGLIAALALVAASGHSGQPVVTIDYKRHESLWRAQRAIVSAYEHIGRAAQTQSAPAAVHAHKAQDLLMEADRELKLAAKPTEK